MNAQVVVAVGTAGPVLVVMSTRLMARQMARAIARHLDESRETRELTAFVRARLGDEHPLVPLLPYRVAYHHAGLPTDVLEALERGPSRGASLVPGRDDDAYRGSHPPGPERGARRDALRRSGPGAQILGARSSTPWDVPVARRRERRLGRRLQARHSDTRGLRPDAAGRRGPVTSPRGLRPGSAGSARRVRRDRRRRSRRGLRASRKRSERLHRLRVAGPDELRRTRSGRIGCDIDAALSSTLAFAQLGPEDQARWRAAARPRSGSVSGIGAGGADGAGQRPERRSGARDRSIRSPQRSRPRRKGRCLRIVDRRARRCAGGPRHGGRPERSPWHSRSLPRAWGFRPTPNAPRSIDVSARAFLERWISGAEIGDTRHRVPARGTKPRARGRADGRRRLRTLRALPVVDARRVYRNHR